MTREHALQDHPREMNATAAEWPERRGAEVIPRNRSGRMHRLIKKAAVALVLLVVYFAAGKLGLRLALVNASASAIWPPTGITLAALLILGYEFWPVILIGAFLVNITTTGVLPTSITVALGNTLEALAGAYLVNRFAEGRQAMARAVNVFKFALLGGLIATAVSATIGVTSLCLDHLAAWSQFGSIWLTWWLGDSTGALTWTPLILLCLARNGETRMPRRWLEAAAFAACLFLSAEVVFSAHSPFSLQHYPVAFLFIPLLVWPAFRFGPRATAATILVLSLAANWSTLAGLGPFVRADANVSLLLLQAFTGVVSVTIVAVAAVVSERAEKELRLREAHSAAELVVQERTAALADANRRLEEELRRRVHVEEHLRASEERYRLLFRRSMAGICLATPEGSLLECNDSFAQFLGYGSAEELRNLRMEAIYFRPEERPALIARLMERGKLNNVELCSRKKDGTQVWLLSNLTIIEGSSETPVLIQASVVDITEITRAQEELRHLSAKLMNSQDEEHRKIARELHDSVGQYLAAISMAVDVARKEPESTARKLDEAAEMTRACIAEVRTISYLLHPPLLEELGLASAIRWYVEGFAARSGIQVQVKMADQLGRLGSDVELALFRVLQESLTNVHRHSGSKTAIINAGVDAKQAWLEVQDEGKGDANGGAASVPFRFGIGLTGMRERVKALGGVLEITRNERGTSVKAVVPLASKARQFVTNVS
jgi:PAS domain S-box-containing protein